MLGRYKSTGAHAAHIPTFDQLFEKLLNCFHSVYTLPCSNSIQGLQKLIQGGFENSAEDILDDAELQVTSSKIWAAED